MECILSRPLRLEFAGALYTKGINEVSKYCAGKISTNKAWVAGDSCSHFKTYNAGRVNFNKQDWSPF